MISRESEVRTTPPDLQDKSKYVKIENVPVLSTHIRRHVEPDGKHFYTSVDDEQLEVLFQNTLEKCENGYIPSIRVGHIRRDQPETTQPPKVGYFIPKGLSTYNGKKTIVADFFMKRESDLRELGIKPYDYILDEFSHRSGEVFRKTEPDGYIDAVALLTRAPELDLGLVTYQSGDSLEHFSLRKDIEYFECPCKKESNMENMDDDSDRDAAIEKIAEALVAKLASSDEFCGTIADRIADKMAENSKDKVDDNPTIPEKLESEESVPSGTNTSIPSSDEDSEDMENNETMAITNVVLAKKNEELTAENKRLSDIAANLTTRLETIEAFQREETSRLRLSSRRAQLESLANKGYSIDVNDELEAFESLDDEHFAKHLTRIEKNYRPSIVGAEPIRTAHMTGKPEVSIKSGSGFTDPISEEEATARAPETFASENSDKYPRRRGETDISWANRMVEAYLALPKEERRKYYKNNGALVS